LNIVRKKILFYIDVFSYCNLRCPSCVVGNKFGDIAAWPRGLMTSDLLGRLEAARLITSALGVTNVTYSHADLQTMFAVDHYKSDFVLVFGLLYHLENPIHTLRLASELSKKYILIETQVFPYDISGRIEDGHCNGQRDVHGVFSLSADYKNWREGGSTDIALVPSLNALLYLMKVFGFNEIEVIKPSPNDYEQFRRGSRVIVYGEK
jgi:tRNA (mo5U34)-methyltransferase